MQYAINVLTILNSLVLALIIFFIVTSDLDDEEDKFENFGYISSVTTSKPFMEEKGAKRKATTGKNSVKKQVPAKSKATSKKVTKAKSQKASAKNSQSAKKTR